MPVHPLTIQSLVKLMPEPFRLYLDQMIRLDVAEVLRDKGYDVIRASEVGQSRSDDYEILQKAIAENRILITLDEHFGDWVILPLSKHPGVIRVKVHPTISKSILKLLLPILHIHSSKRFKDHLVILSSKQTKWIHTA